MVYAQPHRIEAHRPTYTVGKFAAITRFVESHQMIAANISGAGSLYIKLVCSIFFSIIFIRVKHRLHITTASVGSLPLAKSQVHDARSVRHS